MHRSRYLRLAEPDAVRVGIHTLRQVIMLEYSTRFVVSLLGVVVTIGACGDDSPGPDQDELSVGGTYNTAVTLQQNGCTGITVQTFATTVTHTPGASTLTLAHAGNTYTGTVQRNGSFSTTPRAVGGGTETHTLTIAGAFSTTAIDATVTADVQRTGSPNCQYVVKWVGPRQSGVNVIPGS